VKITVWVRSFHISSSLKYVPRPSENKSDNWIDISNIDNITSD